MADISKIKLPNGTTYDVKDTTKLPTSGGTITGAVSLAGTDFNLKTSGTSSDDSGDIVWYYGNGQEKARLWTNNEYTAAAGLNYRVYKKDGTSLATGTIPLTNTNTTYTLSTSGNSVTLTPSSGSVQSITVPYSTLSNTVNGVYTLNGGQQGPDYFGKNRVGFLMSNATVAGDTHFKNWLYMDNYNGNDVGGATALGIDRTEPRAFIMQSDANRTSWNNTAALGVFTATPTSGQVVVTDGTTGGIKSSGYTIAKSVPSNAVFTDNNTTYTFANGTNGFTVTPSGGTAQTVTVTPSITNNITGSGTSGYIAKFNGTNTITNGPAFGSTTTTYLNNAGSWATPPDTKNTAGSTNTSSKIFLIGATSQAANPQTYSNSGVSVSGSGELSMCTWSVKNGSLYSRAECYVDAEDRGRINVYDENGIGRIMLTGNNGITLNDSSDTTTIFLDSEDGRVECEKMSYVNETVTFSKSSGSWSFAEGEYTRSGQVVQVVVQFKGGGSNVAVGSNSIVGTINGIPNPPRTIRLQGYYSSTALMGELTSSGGFNVRVLGAALNLSTSNKATLSGTYIVED